MKRFLLLMMILSCITLTTNSQKVSIEAVNKPAASVFRSLIEQTGKNFIYSSELLKDVKVTVKAKNQPLKDVLSYMFADTHIEYKIKGNNVILKRKKLPRKRMKTPKHNLTIPKAAPPSDNVKMLDEVVVVSRLESPITETAEIGAKKITSEEVRNIPVLLGEPDVIKALHTQPGVTEGAEGMAGMNVHGGASDENLYMLDNIPLYQVNHFAGLFSAFNNDIIRYIDFFKSSMPAKYDGRLSSFMDVRLKNGISEGHHGSGRLGLTSGAFNISGPIGSRTTYLVGLRRSWYDVLSIPILSIINSKTAEKTRFHYYFMDLNAKITHRFSNKATGLVSIYFGNDMLKTGSNYDSEESIEDDKYDFHWGNLVAQAALNYRFNQKLSGEFTAAYTRYFSDMKHHDLYKNFNNEVLESIEEEHLTTKNNINDWIIRGDFDWQPSDNSRIRFGANYIRHSFLPARTSRKFTIDDNRFEFRDSTWTYGANEVNLYIEDDWRINDKFRINAGFHASLFDIDGKMKHGLSPRISLSYRASENTAVKAAYSRTTQYVHQLSQSYLTLPTDQWIPVSGNFKPQTADKISIGGYWQSQDNSFAISIEGYYKWMHNVIDYRDEYYLKPPLDIWTARITQGDGTAKGLDFKIEKLSGRITGHISYSLAWADRTFAEKNGGKTYPARFDNRHTINVLVNWNINDKVSVNASWTGHSGNRFTLLPQSWENPSFGTEEYIWDNASPLRSSINNYQLPFYHRLDLSCIVRNKHGYWSFGLYNAYCHMNVIGIRRGYKYENETISYNTRIPVFQKIKLLPTIPSISYTWEF